MQIDPFYDYHAEQEDAEYTAAFGPRVLWCSLILPPRPIGNFDLAVANLNVKDVVGGAKA